MTTSACPTQWEGRLEDGQTLYVRYRHGWLQAGTGPDLEAAVTATWSEEYREPGTRFLYSGSPTDDDYGVMSTKEMRAHLGCLLDFACDRPYERNERPLGPELEQLLAEAVGESLRESLLAAGLAGIRSVAVPEAAAPPANHDLLPLGSQADR